MSRADYNAALQRALDRFDVPAPREGFADRMMAATAPVFRSSERDRRGGWKLARRVVIGTLAAGMVSAAAVASGLLGAAGIQVPVLTAMLAPTPAAKPVVKAHKPVTRMAMAPKPRVAATKAEDPGLTDPGSIAPPIALRPGLGNAMARRTERRLERRALLRQNPELRPVLRQAVRDERAFVRNNPEVRTLRRLPATERRAFLAERPDLKAALRTRWAERRAFRADNPQMGEMRRARRDQRRGTAIPTPVEPSPSDSPSVVPDQ